MKKLIFLLAFLLPCVLSRAQRSAIDFGTTTGIFECNPLIFTTTNQLQCVDSTTISCNQCKAIMYYNTDGGSFGQDCRNWFKLTDPGFNSIGTFSELQLRGAGGGNTLITPARLVVRDFIPTDLFAIQFDVLLAGYGGEFLFRCGSGKNYGDTVFMPDRDSFSFLVLKFDDGNPSVSQPYLRYSRSLGNSAWPTVGPYSWATSNALFNRYQKHTVAVYANNSDNIVSYNYIYSKNLNPRSYDLYVDSVIDVSNVLDTFYPVQNKINSFMFSRNNAFCANSGLYRGDTLVLDNIIWTSDFVNYILPIELTSFYCHLENNKPKLMWQTASESNNEKFEIERSVDGTGFQNVGEIAGVGNSNRPFDYSWIDSSCVSDLVYYRLKQIDFDGRYTYSDVCQIKVVPNGSSLTFPNPFTDKINFSEPTSGILYNSLGQKVILVENAIAIKTEYLPHGVYYFIPTFGSPVRLLK